MILIPCPHMFSESHAWSADQSRLPSSTFNSSHPTSIWGYPDFSSLVLFKCHFLLWHIECRQQPNTTLIPRLTFHISLWERKKPFHFANSYYASNLFGVAFQCFDSLSLFLTSYIFIYVLNRETNMYTAIENPVDLQDFNINGLECAVWVHEWVLIKRNSTSIVESNDGRMSTSIKGSNHTV